jgi:flagellar biosynthesis protein FliR
MDTSIDPALSLLLGARVAPMAVLLPAATLRGSSRLPSLAVGLALGLCLLPIVSELPHARLGTGALLLPALLAELFRGLVFALAVALPLHAFAWSGALMDRVRGDMPELDALDTPMTASPLTLLYHYGALAVLFASGAHLLVVDALADGLVRFPLGSVPELASPTAWLHTVVALVSRALALAMSLAAPALLCAVGLSLVLGLVARVAGPLQPALSQGPLVPMLTLGVVCLVAAATLPEADTALRVFLREAERVLSRLG